MAIAITTMTEPQIPAKAMIWFSPAFPVGAYAYSQGLEAAVQQGLVNTHADLLAWLKAIIANGSLRNDLILLGQAWRSTLAGDIDDLIDCNDRAVALAPSATRHLETTQQGRSFADVIAASWPAEGQTDTFDRLDGDIAYPVAIGIAGALHGLPLAGLAHGFALGFATNFVSAAIRLSVIGQTDAQRVLADLAGCTKEAAEQASTLSLDDLGSFTPMADYAAIAHETLYSRLFRS